MDEDALIRHRYVSFPRRPGVALMAVAMGRSQAAVAKRAMALGLAREYATPALQKEMRELRAAGYSYGAIIKRLAAGGPNAPARKVSIAQVRRACKGVLASGAWAPKTARPHGGRKLPMKPNVASAVDAVRRGECSMNKAAMLHGCTLDQVTRACRQSGVQSPFARGGKRRENGT